MKKCSQSYLKPRPPIPAYFDIVKRIRQKMGQFSKKTGLKSCKSTIITEGVALLYCETDTIEMKAGDIAIISSNELHSLENHSAQLSCCVLCLEPPERQIR